MMNEQNVPELRFPEFSGEWEESFFGAMISNKSEKYTPDKSEEVVDIELDSIESDTGRLLHTYDSRTQKSQKNRFKNGEVLYSKLRPYLNKYYMPNFSGVCTSEIWVFSSKNHDQLKNQFIYYFIQTSRFGQIANKSAGSKMPRADWNLVENIKFSYPTVDEQQKISNLLIKLDRLIELEEKKLELLEEQKKGYMQKIFSQELRFKDENGNDYPEWEEKKLGELADFSKGKGISKGDITKEGEVCVLYGELYTKYKDVIYEVYSKTDVSSNSLKVAYKNSVLIPSSGETPIDIAKATALSVDNVLIGGDINILEPVSGYHGPFISQIINEKYKNELAKFSQGKTVVHLYNNDIKKLEIELPNYNEQRKISAFLVKFDKLIEAINTKIEQMSNRKKSLLQRMFI